MISTKTTVHSNLEGANRNISIKNKNFAGESESLSYRIGISIEFSAERSVKRAPHCKNFTKGCIESDSSSINLLGLNCSTNLEAKGAKQSLILSLFFPTP